MESKHHPSTIIHFPPPASGPFGHFSRAVVTTQCSRAFLDFLVVTNAAFVTTSQVDFAQCLQGLSRCHDLRKNGIKFERGQRAENRGQRAEGGGQRAEGREQRSEVRGQRSKSGSQRSAFSIQPLAVSLCTTPRQPSGRRHRHKTNPEERQRHVHRLGNRADLDIVEVHFPIGDHLKIDVG